MAKSKKRSPGPLIDELSSIELAEIGLTLNIIGDIFGLLSIVKAKEEMQALAQSASKSKSKKPPRS
ncbi:hypothetical protein [Paenibacillus sp.]|uniref:hypothetical protein n=1 Tax=Paenibacillus sp. TaxID=58172 RepID=UPI00281C56EE|nr:hypothetical protein [Paenibacillus sp.]MDR0268876.1 hypothetical protein [Paenibacillus sp.]